MSFRDTGRGISEEDLAKVFLPYFTTRDGGTGLGMAIVHELVSAMRGTIQVQSVLGVGTTFTVHLPLRSATVENVG